MNDSQVPSESGANGRRPDGKFAPGNRAGRGNPHAKRAQKLRSAVLSAVKPNDIKEVIEKLVELAKAGDTTAIKILLEKVIGKQSVVDSVPVAIPQDQQSEGERRQKALAKLKGAGLTLVSDNDDSESGDNRHVS